MSLINLACPVKANPKLSLMVRKRSNGGKMRLNERRVST